MKQPSALAVHSSDDPGARSYILCKAFAELPVDLLRDLSLARIGAADLPGGATEATLGVE